jgi:muconate cycloisomerase
MIESSVAAGPLFTLRRVNCSVREHPLRPERIVRSHAGTHDRSTYLLVELEDKDGCRGWGEGATTPLWSGEWAASEAVAITGLFGPGIVGCELAHPCELSPLLDVLGYGHPFAKSAIETAAWDLWARKQNRSVLSLIADRDPPTSVPTRASVGAYPPVQTLEMSRRFFAAGVRHLKFKVGVPGVDDVQRLQSVRRELGPDVLFSLDANGAYRTPDEALRALDAMLPSKVEVFEQPTPRDRLDLLAQVRKRSAIPVMADESIFTADELAMALDLDAFDVLSVYPGKNGGLGNALTMARTASAAGKGCAIGSNLESDIGLAAMVTLAAGCRAFDVERWAGDFASSLYYLNSSARQPLALADGRIQTPGGIGFGVEPAAH